MLCAKIIFEWNQWNIQKNELKHGVSVVEAGSAFYDNHYALFVDIKHTTVKEKRFILLGQSLENRLLMIGFTLRQEKICVITARPASTKERLLYENQTP